jgi:orotate phosphoribosyltransferase
LIGVDRKWLGHGQDDAILAAEIDAAARLTGAFKLRSGQFSSEYFDKYRFEADPALLGRLALKMLPLIPSGTEVLAGLELGGVPIATAMSLAAGLPLAFVRKKAKEYGTFQAVEGAGINGRRVVLVEDVITTGGAVADAERLVRETGGEVLGVVCAIWRGDGSPRINASPGLLVRAAFTKEDLDQENNRRGL